MFSDMLQCFVCKVFPQVEKFEQLLFDFVEKKVGFRPTSWVRFSDQCAGQFKSQ